MHDRNARRHALLNRTAPYPQTLPGLSPRPIKIDNDLDAHAQADEPAMLVNLAKHESKRA
jgi:hypothetical protein